MSRCCNSAGSIPVRAALAQDTQATVRLLPRSGRPLPIRRAASPALEILFSRTFSNRQEKRVLDIAENPYYHSSGRQDSNLRPSAPKARVLLICKRQAGAGISPQKQSDTEFDGATAWLSMPQRATLWGGISPQISPMPRPGDWVTLLRAGLSHSLSQEGCRSGITVNE